MKTLDQLAIGCGADKASIHPVKGHNYAVHYDAVFSSIRNNPLKVLEIGVGSGESIRMWLEYFPNAQVFGIDIVNSTNIWNTVVPTDAKELMNFPLMGLPSRYKFVTADQSSEVFWDCFVATYGSDWDILVDDGGHSSQQIITTFNKMWPHIKRGGFYAIEDLGCAYSSLEFFCTPGWQNHMSFVKDMLDQINRGQNDIDSMRFSNELAILQKKA